MTSRILTVSAVPLFAALLWLTWTLPLDRLSIPDFLIRIPVLVAVASVPLFGALLLRSTRQPDNSARPPISRRCPPALTPLVSLVAGLPPYDPPALSRRWSLCIAIVGAAIIAYPLVLIPFAPDGLGLGLPCSTIFGAVLLLLGLTNLYWPTSAVHTEVQHPVLGALTYSHEKRAWDATVTLSGRPIAIDINPALVEGVYVPDPQLLEHATHIFANFPTFQQRMNEFLHTEAAHKDVAGFSEEILQLQIAGIGLWRPPNEGMIFFAGSEERFWRCDYSGRPQFLGYDD